MSGLSKTDRQRILIKRQRAEIETWREWAQDLIGEGAAEEGDGIRGGPVDTRLRQTIGRVWDATRERVNTETAATSPTWREAADRPLRLPESEDE